MSPKPIVVRHVKLKYSSSHQLVTPSAFAIVSMKNEPGVLYSILQPFATRGLNLTKIESRPTKRRPWEYVNFLDFEGHCETANVRDVLDEVRERCQFLKVLGSYPAV